MDANALCLAKNMEYHNKQYVIYSRAELGGTSDGSLRTS